MRFFVKETQRTATDQVCRCGHLASLHADVVLDQTGTVFTEDSLQVVHMRSGLCQLLGCICEKFEWFGWHYDGERAETTPS